MEYKLEDYNGVSFDTEDFTATNNQTFINKGLYQLEFRNLGSTLCRVQGVDLYPAFMTSGGLPMLNTTWKWTPAMLAGERDVTSYKILFFPLPNPFVAVLKPEINRLIIIKKFLASIPPNQVQRQSKLIRQSEINRQRRK